MLRAMAAWLSGERQAEEVSFDFAWTDAWESAIAVSPTVGLDPSGAAEAVPPERLLDELRLEGDDGFHAVRSAALARLLALRAADRRGLTAGRRAVSDALSRLRGAHGLFRRDALNRWLAENDLTTGDLERLLEDEARLEAYADLVAPALHRPVLDHLRAHDRYRSLADRARRKHAALNALGSPDPKPEDLGVTPVHLAIWYFEERLGRAVPDDLDGFARGLGLPDRASYYRLLAREYLFLRGAERADEGD